MSDNRWIIWQNACEATHHKILEELRVHFRSKAVIPHTETLELLEDFYLPLMPKETIDIDAEDPPTPQQMPSVRISKPHPVDPPVCGERDMTIEEEAKHSMELYKKIDRQRLAAISEICATDESEDWPVNIANAYDILMGNAICKREA